jgi:hypothetical protein
MIVGGGGVSRCHPVKKLSTSGAAYFRALGMLPRRYDLHQTRMIPVRDLFESHLTVVDLQRSMTFFGQTLGLELAHVYWERRVAFYWIGGRGNSMLGLWEVGTSPQRLSLHLAFRVDLEELLDTPARLRAAHLIPLDFQGEPTWMGIYLSCCRCCLMLPSLSSELSAGVAGGKATNPIRVGPTERRANHPKVL